MSTAPSDHPTATEEFDQFGATLGAPAFYGPPVLFLFGPWLLFGLLLAPPAAVLITLALVAVVAAAALAALVAVAVSPYLLVRHVYARRSAHRRAHPRKDATAHAPVHPAPAISEVVGPHGWRPVREPAGAHLVHLAAR